MRFAGEVRAKRSNQKNELQQPNESTKGMSQKEVKNELENRVEATARINEKETIWTPSKGYYRTDSRCKQTWSHFLARKTNAVDQGHALWKFEMNNYS